MSVPGGPPGKNGTKDGDAEATYWLYASDAVKGSGYYQKTLAELSEAMADSKQRAAALVLLRALRLVHTQQEGLVNAEQINKLQGSELGTKCAHLVLRLPRLSEVSVLLGVKSIVENPHHIDADWYGYPPGSWWGDVNGRHAEVIAALKHLHFLEDSFGLKRTEGTDPRSWDWGEGNQTDDWVEGMADFAKTPPPFKEGFQKVRMEWHCGLTPDSFDCVWSTQRGVATFAFHTPVTTGNDAV